MIKISGSASQSFTFPADRITAYEYYSDLGRLLDYLPHIYLVHQNGHNRLRAMYNTLELGSYRIKILCDLYPVLDEGKRILRVNSTISPPEIEPKAGLTSAATRGSFTIESHFDDQEEQTRIDYRLWLRANLPTPLGLRVVPGRVMKQIADRITMWRIREIVDGFVQDSIASFPHWQSEQPRASTQLQPACQPLYTPPY